MLDSDDEVEIVTLTVTDYTFEDEKEEDVSFSTLPFQWSACVRPDSMEKTVYLHGTVESGREQIYKQVIAWKLELSYNQAEVSVLCKDKSWIKLQKPRNSFQDTVRTILITVQYLHFLKKHPETSEKSLWGHLQKTFSLYDPRPSEKDLLDHLPLISAAAKLDKTLSKSKLILSFLKKSRKRKEFDKDIDYGSDLKKQKFIVEDAEEESDENTDNEIGDESDEAEDMFDSVCAICDNGGRLICCDGGCLRSFHATVDAGIEAGCKSLGLSWGRVDATQHFLCLNCQYKQHQCFACGELGSSDKSCDPEVFPCQSGTCGYFYHAQCVAKLFYPGNEVKAECFQKHITAGKSFTCPVHKCLVCKQGENKDVFALQFAVCRRCPKAYHRKCLPRGIAFTDSADTGIVRRAWDDLLTRSRVLIYCLKHNLDETVMTPARNHIKFPGIKVNKKARPSDSQSSQLKVSEIPDWVKSKHRAVACKKLETAAKLSPIKKDSGSSRIDSQVEERQVDRVKRRVPPIMNKKVIAKPKALSACASTEVGKAAARPREIVQTALPKLVDSNVEVEKADCQPEVLNEITKLKIVDKLHWYVQNGDTIACFCSDSDDYSGLMRKKLEETGKRFSLKNFHVFQAKSGNNFRRMDGFCVDRTSLPTGSRLIVGLTIPPGVKEVIVEEVISEVLLCKPKLLILIVPSEAERLSEKTKYDLIWEDSAKITDKAYFPGSSSVKQIERLNLRASLLYLCSRKDWTSKHEDIALQQRHVSKRCKDLNLEKKHIEAQAPERVINQYVNEQNAETHQPKEARAAVHEEAKQSSVPKDNTVADCSSDVGNDTNKIHDSRWKGPSKDTKVQNDGKQNKGKLVTPREGGQDSVIHKSRSLSRSVSSDSVEAKGSVNGFPDEAFEAPFEKACSEESIQGRPAGSTSESRSKNEGTQRSTVRENGTFNTPRQQCGFASGPLLPYSTLRRSGGWLEE